jgi:hypothetical protein
VDPVETRIVRAGVEIGTAYRGAVVRQDRIETPTTWLASVNAG